MQTLSAFLLICLIAGAKPQAPHYPNHYYGNNLASIARKQVLPREQWPEPVRDPQSGTVAPHLCGFNPFTRRCMDPDNLCPGRCMNFNYVFNSKYDCRCLVV